VLNLQSIYPNTTSEEDKQASVRHEVFHNGSFLDPLFKGEYPPSFIEEVSQHLPKEWRKDLPTIKQDLDFWGLNYYTPIRVTTQHGNKAQYPRTMEASARPDVERTDIGWEVDASTFKDLIVNLYNNYDLPPCYITENGACYNEEPVNGVVADDRRQTYLEQHIGVIAECCQKKDTTCDLAWYTLTTRRS